MQIHEALAQRMVELAKERNRTVTELARLGGIRQSTISEILQGRSVHPRINTILLYSKGCGITLNEFFDSPLFDSIEVPEKKTKKKQP